MDFAGSTTSDDQECCGRRELYVRESTECLYLAVDACRRRKHRAVVTGTAGLGQTALRNYLRCDGSMSCVSPRRPGS